MLAGTLTKRIILVRPTIIRDDLGGEKVIKEKVAEVWAKAEAISNKKIRTADQKQVIETKRFTIRPREDVDIDWMIEYQKLRFTIRAIERDLPDRLIIITEVNPRSDKTSKISKKGL